MTNLTCFSFLLIAFVLHVTNGLNCYECQTDDVAKCNVTRMCNTGESCFTNATHNQQGVTYSLGCIQDNKCNGFDGSGSLIGKRELQCVMCCTRDLCNSALCGSISSQNCVDDEQEDCSKLNSLFHICNDVKHARLICPRYCNLCHIVDGEWSVWSTWSSCSVTCANGTMTRSRQCNNPAPSPQGEQCRGNNKETSTCSFKACPVHGGWTTWSPWGLCSVTCDIGMQRRDRSCSNPYPSSDGDYCPGDSRDDRVCLTNGCMDGNWSAWSSWSSCSVTCGYGLKSRHRQCDNPKPSVLGTFCIGNSMDEDICFNKTCNDGNWSDWSSWSSCSVTCGYGLKSRHRQCDNPKPSVLGSACVGNYDDEDICFNKTCNVDVIFKARDLTKTNPSSAETLIFTNVIQNVGNGYDKSTGVFTAPVDGTYLFIVKLCSYSNNHIWFAIVCDGVKQNVGSAYGHDYFDCTSVDSTLILKSGQRVWIIITIGTNTLAQSDNFWNVFSGVLIHQ